MIKGVIFDLDGVITFTDKYHYLAWKALADELGIYFDEEINNRLRGVSRMDSLDIILEKSSKTYTKEEKEEFAEKKNAMYVSLLDNLTDEDCSIDVRNTLLKLKELGLKIAIGSSSKNTLKILDKIGITSLFDCIVDGNLISKSKPDPEVFLKAASILNINPSEALVVEDAISGIDAGFNGGFITCGIGEASMYNKTTHPIKNISEVLNYIDDKKEAVISLKNIKKIYPNGVNAVKDFSLDINEGEFVVFVGPSGCGKSTVLRMIAGLEEITDGLLLIDGIVMNDQEPKDRNIAMVFQNYALYPHLSVRKNIGFALLNENIGIKHFFDFKYRKQRKLDIYKKVDEVAKKIGLTDYLDRKPKNLSGGQRQRVALGRAIIRNPKAFLLDEPLSNLDAKMRAEMRTEISKLHNELKTIFIYVTHDQVEAMTMAKKIVVLKDGIIQQIGTPNEVFMKPVNKFVASFIGTPQMNFFEGVLEKIDTGLIFKNDYLTLNIPSSLNIDSTYINKEVILGIRPKAIDIVENSSIKGEVSISEQLGDEALIYFKLGSEKEFVSSMQTFSNYEVGQTIYIDINLEHASLFDKESELSIC